MSTTETMNAIEGLSEEQRRRALQLQAQLKSLESELHALLRQSKAVPAATNLAARGINETQAADLRARLNTFAEDWDRPETAIYDESPAR